MKEFVLGVLATFLMHVVAAFLYFFFHNKWIPSFRQLARSVSSLFREFVSAGGVTVYTSRHNLRLLLGPIKSYILGAERTLTYYGIQFYTLEDEGALAAIKELVGRNVSFSCYSLDPDSALIDSYARFLSRDADQLKIQISSNIAKLKQLKNSLAPELQDRVKLFTHGEILPASCFVFDENEKISKVLLDHKLFSGDRSKSFGVELCNKEHALFKAIVESMKAIRKYSKPVL